MTTRVVVDALDRMRESLKELPSYEGLTYNHLIVKACALALKKMPRVNAQYRDGTLVQPQQINVGIVTAVSDGLLIPVVKNADELPLADLVSSAMSLIQRARADRPKAEDLLEGTFAISNIGKSDVESFTAIINPGQGEIKVRKVIRLTLSADHRILDGVIAAQFLDEVKRLMKIRCSWSPRCFCVSKAFNTGCSSTLRRVFSNSC